jgi:transcriptional regulator with XRE-family HTH domain
MSSIIRAALGKSALLHPARGETLVELEKSAARLAEGLGKLLLRYRTENSLTRTQLAEKLDLSEGRIRQLESGDNAQSFKIDFLLSAANVLGLTPPDLLSQLMHESKIGRNTKAQTSLEDAFTTSVENTPMAAIFKNSLSKTDELFGNHFVWALKMASMMLELDEAAKARIEIALRRACPLKGTDEYRARIMRLLDFDLDH